MIHETFDPDSAPVITPEKFYGTHEPVCDVCIITFSQIILQYILQAFPCKKLAVIGSCREEIPVYGFPLEGRTVGVYLSMIGSCGAGTCIHEAHCLTGAKHYVMFGSAGCLDQRVADRVVIPTQAFRDEGMSYHYAPADDYIDVRNAGFVAGVLQKAGVPCVLGRTWTTDAIYRETEAHRAARRADGCLTVEMECAGAQAVCDYLGVEFYDFLLCGDVLDLPDWSVGKLQKANHSLGNFNLALLIAQACAEKK